MSLWARRRIGTSIGQICGTGKRELAALTLRAQPQMGWSDRCISIADPLAGMRVLATPPLVPQTFKTLGLDLAGCAAPEPGRIKHLQPYPCEVLTTST